MQNYFTILSVLLLLLVLLLSSSSSRSSSSSIVVVTGFVINNNNNHNKPLSLSLPTITKSIQQHQQQQQQRIVITQNPYQQYQSSSSRSPSSSTFFFSKSSSLSFVSSPSSSTTALYGIPKMFRWLTDQYPEILNKQLTEQGLRDDLIVDNFYLDMNGIIHPCTHGKNDDPSVVVLDETVMFQKIFRYVDRLYKLVQPKQLLYLAVDGVAPRAKMNQQRSRRFRSAKDTELLLSNIIAQSNYISNPTNYQGSIRQQPITTKKTIVQNQLSNPNSAFAMIDPKRFDSNCITPGTDFMYKLCIAMERWIEYKMNNDPFYSTNGAHIIISGPNIPGEGEHKVMDFIREQRELAVLANQNKNYNDDDDITTTTTTEQKQQHYYWSPSATHVLYGLDADLIMLGLVTHEPNFMLLREKMSVVMAGRGRSNNNNNNKRRGGGYQQPNRKKKDMLEYDKNDFEVLELKLLRQMLAIQFRKFADDNIFKKEQYNLNRIIDDFVFTCMLIGNDFLPHIPHLEIDSGALSLMMSTYIDLLSEWGGYITNRHKIHPHRLEQFIYELAIYEEEHFKRRGYEENEIGWQLSSDESNENDVYDFYGTYYTGNPTPPCAVPANDNNQQNQKYVNNVNDPNLPKEETMPMKPTGNRSFRRKYPGNNCRSYRDFYYATKLGWNPEDRSRTLYRRRQHVREYIRGLHWNLHYYHNGCQSWDWYFPYLYAPLATDIVNIHEFYNTTNADSDGYCTFDFELGEPFPSLAQLLAVLPPQSSDLLPKPLAELMINPLSSPITQFYPPDFTTDANGKRQSWEAIVQIPFIDGDLLLQTVQQILDRDAQLVQQKMKSLVSSTAINGTNADDGEGTTTTAPIVSPESITGLLTPAERRRNLIGKVHTFIPPKQLPELQEQDFIEKNSQYVQRKRVSSSTTTSLTTREYTTRKRSSSGDVEAITTTRSTSTSSKRRIADPRMIPTTRTKQLELEIIPKAKKVIKKKKKITDDNTLSLNGLVDDDNEQGTNQNKDEKNIITIKKKTKKQQQQTKKNTASSVPSMIKNNQEDTVIASKGEQIITTSTKSTKKRTLSDNVNME